MKLDGSGQANIIFALLILITFAGTMGFLLYSIQLYSSGMEEYYIDTVPRLNNESLHLIELQITSNMSVAEKLKIIDSTCKIKFPTTFGSNGDQIQCNQFVISKVIK